MRTFLILLLLSVALASAGCFGKEDGEDPPATTTPGGTTTTPPTGTTTPTTGGAGNSTNNTNTTPPRPAARELCPVSKDFSGQQPAPGATTVTTAGDCGTVPAGYTQITLNGNFTSTAPALVHQGIAVRVLDAAGTAVLTCSAPAPPATSPAACTQQGPVTPGAYTLAFDGFGAVSFAGSVGIS